MDKAQFFVSPTGSRRVRVWTNISNPEISNGDVEVLGTHGMSPLSTLGYIGRLFDLAAQANRPLIFSTVLCNHEYDYEFETQLLGCFPNFATHLFVVVYEWSTWGRGTVILLNTTDNRFVTFSFHECVPEKMGEFWSIERRQDRVAKFEQWAFLDLDATFSGWPTIRTNARRELARRHASLYSSANAVADLDIARIIHQDMANVIALRQDLCLFNAAYAKYSQILNVPE
ncbi:uncharacterized protein FSUBG_12167 [Fusarium subglutinans]|uniref:Uncharacterized protein n=1 Tax=Gibberella subglutinans TaxID=42677 RepID=A0A8H5L7Z3_GIBSU|nr:uncharacterized protein FSUBG_12167 [Fusarium subglutinans]KAF5586397.1 hypothetical protein FSUBG_12167 [Fusarium subglutinans]